jgi:hypothetical protein
MHRCYRISCQNKWLTSDQVKVVLKYVREVEANGGGEKEDQLLLVFSRMDEVVGTSQR